MMRTSIVLGLSLFAGACVGVVESPGGGGDDGSGSNPGSGSDPGSGSNPAPTPMLAVTMDKTAIATELNTTNMFQVTVTGSDTFAGAVNFTATVADKVSGAPLTGWTVSMPSPTVTLTENGTTTFPLSVMVPSQNMGLDGVITLKATATGVADQTMTSEVTATNQVTLLVTLNGGQCQYPTDAAMTVTLGTKVRFVNMGPTGSLIIHSNGNGGIAHQDTAAPIAPNAAYEQVTSSVTDAADPNNWYCHAPGPQAGNTIAVVAATP